MSDVGKALLELRDVGIGQLPELGDAGDRRVRTVWEREIASGRRPRFGWMRRKIMIRGFGITPALLFAVVASAAAAATGAIVAVNATTIFQKNPQQQERDRSGHDSRPTNGAPVFGAHGRERFRARLRHRPVLGS